MSESVRIEWIGVRLPSEHPLLQYQKLTGDMPKRHIAALKVIDMACTTHVRQGNSQIGWEFGPTKDDFGLSKHYRFMPDTHFIQDMSLPDWRILKKSIWGCEFRNLDDAADAKREPDYPPQELMAKVKFNRFGEAVYAGDIAAGLAARLVRNARRSRLMPITIGETIHRRELQPR